MKRKIIGIFVCTLLIATALPVVGAINLNQVDEKIFSTISSDDGYGDILISVWIRHNRPSEIYVDDAEVTATHIETGEMFNVEFREHPVLEGYWLHGPIGKYHIEAKRGLRRGSTQEGIAEEGLSFADVDLAFIKNANVHHEQPVLSILRLIFSRLPIFK